MTIILKKSVIIIAIIVIIVCTGCKNTEINTSKNNNKINKKISQFKAADDAYNYWKNKYVVSVNANESRVIDPQNNNITVSEGMGYGMLFSASSGDSKLFKKLWAYSKNYLDENGLMNWKIDSDGKVSGFGSASDADQDMAYALLIASKKWNNKIYKNDAVKLINAISNKEISMEYVVLPGDSWDRGSIPINLSYISPMYYSKFGKAVKDEDYWNKVSSVNFKLLQDNANQTTGLFPDWINTGGYSQLKNNQFGYDAVRIPIRLLQYDKNSNNAEAKAILEKEYSFISKISLENLRAGYDVNGNALVNYLNTTYLSSFSAMSLVEPDSQYSKAIINKLKADQEDSYFGCSLKTWIFLIIAGRLQ